MGISPSQLQRNGWIGLLLVPILLVGAVNLIAAAITTSDLTRPIRFLAVSRPAGLVGVELDTAKLGWWQGGTSPLGAECP